ncbi:hypothetical protein M426DRAFT_317724 [Hypoxylon sp. CI-4A]|nr:hypothetical protein M426DRAFT_317724 [Hypoxylon sp. CI-4A]
MFEVPDAKRVRREELYNPASDEESTHDDELDSTLRGKLNEQLSGLLDLSFAVDEGNKAHQPSESQTRDADKNSPNGGDSDEPQEEVFAFRLFRDEDTSRKVVLEPQNAGKGGESTLAVKRPMSYYLAEDPSSETINNFRAAAVSADFLLQDAKKRRWGLEKPWKVTTITITTNKKMGTPVSLTTSGAGIEVNQKKKRPGKKRRIILRVREKANKEKEEAAKKQLIDKEEHVKEKKKRQNRQKQLRRRAKAREKKGDTKDDDAASEQDARDSSPDQE